MGTLNPQSAGTDPRFLAETNSILDAPGHLRVIQRITRTASWQGVFRFPGDISVESLQWSEEAVRMLGYAPGEITISADLVMKHVHPDDAPLLRQTISESIKNCRPYDIRYRIIRGDGRVIRIHERGESRRVPDSDGYVQVIGIMQDVTAQRRARRYESILKSIVSRSSMAYILLDSELRIVAFNDTAHANAVTHLGVKLKTGDSILEFTEPVKRRRAQKLFRAAVAGNEYGYEHCFTGKNGLAAWCQINLFPVQLERNRVNGLALSLENITARKIAEDKLRASQAKYHSFFLNSMNALFITRKDGDILEVNPAACKLFRMTESEIITAGRFGLVDTTDPNVQIMLEQRQRTGQAFGEIIFVRKDGTSFPGILTSSVYVDANGEERTSMAVYDITEQKKAQALLAQHNSELQSLTDHLSNVREEERATIAREIHDELGQQLTTLKMGVNMMQKNMAAHGIAETNASSLLGEIDEAIKSVRRIASNLRPVILDYEGLSAAIKWYAQDFEKLHGITCNLQVDIPCDLQDQKLSITLFRIFQESFTNILRHASATAVDVDMHVQQGHIRLCIRDNGIGIDLCKVRGKRSFGIISMRERVEMVSGRFRIEAHPEGGTLTEVVVPYAEPGAE